MGSRTLSKQAFVLQKANLAKVLLLKYIMKLEKTPKYEWILEK